MASATAPSTCESTGARRNRPIRQVIPMPDNNVVYLPRRTSRAQHSTAAQQLAAFRYVFGPEEDERPRMTRLRQPWLALSWIGALLLNCFLWATLAAGAIGLVLVLDAAVKAFK
jgi:hypothetical protein